MKKIIFVLLILVVLSFLSAQSLERYYEINLNYDKGELDILEVKVDLFSEEKTNLFGTYTIITFDDKNGLIESDFFEIPNKILYDEVDENGSIVSGGEIELEQVNFTLYAPYYENTSEIIIYDENVSEKLKIDVSMYSTIQKDTSIEEDENESEGEGITRENEEKSKKLEDYWWVLLIMLIILVLVFINSLRKKKPNQNI